MPIEKDEGRAALTAAGLKLAEIIGGVIALAVVAYFSLTWAFSALVHSHAEKAVPDLSGKSAMAALDVLAQSGLALNKQGSEFDASVPVGSILRQVPPAGTIVREGKVIRVWFSQGGESVLAPALVGLQVRNAELLLRQNQLLLGEESESYSLSVEKGTVMSQDPKADSPVSKNAMINLVVSAGQPPSEIILMPDFRQKKLAEAQKWATDAGVSLTVSEDSTSLFPSDTIIAQELPPDSTVNKGTNVAITISKRKDGGADRFHNIHYELSQGGAQAKLRIVIIDKLGEREVFNGLRNPGSKIDLKVPYGGPAKVRIFVNGVQVDEREMP